MVTIHPRNEAGFLKSNECLGSPNSFTNITACNTGSCSFYWELGAAKTSTVSQPVVNYDSPGGYLVKLRVTNPVGCPDSVSSLVVVHPVPAALFGQSAFSLCANDPVYFSVVGQPRFVQLGLWGRPHRFVASCRHKL
jgi:hypothetical protein